MSDTVDPSSILMTDDGHPIGELVLADNASVPMPTEETVEANREDLMKAAAADLTGNPDSDSAVAELYPGYSDPDRRKKAMTAYVTEDRSIEEIARLVDVPCRTVSMWIYNGQWDELAKKELAVRQSQSILDLARFRAERRLEIAKEQIEQAKMIRDTAADRIQNDEGSLKSNTEAWAAASKIEHTLVGMSESGDIASITEKKEDKDSKGKTPLVVVFNGGLPPVRKHV